MVMLSSHSPNKNIRISLVALLISLCSFSAYAENNFRFLGEPTAPLIIMNKQHQLDGALVEIAHALIKQTGINATIEIMPWARAYEKALHEPNIVLMSLLKTPEREAQFRWIGKVHEANASMFRLAQRQDIHVTSIQQARQFLVASVRGYGSATYLLNNGFTEQNNLILATQPEQLWDMLYNNRVDMVLSNSETSPFDAAAAGYDPDHLVHVFEVPQLTHDLHFATGTATSLLQIKLLQKGLQNLNESGVISDIKNRWHISHYAKSTDVTGKLSTTNSKQ